MGARLRKFREARMCKEGWKVWKKGKKEAGVILSMFSLPATAASHAKSGRANPYCHIHGSHVADTNIMREHSGVSKFFKSKTDTLPKDTTPWCFCLLSTTGRKTWTTSVWSCWRETQLVIQNPLSDGKSNCQGRSNPHRRIISATSTSFLPWRLTLLLF